jgi:hypothetical protein
MMDIIKHAIKTRQLAHIEDLREVNYNETDTISIRICDPRPPHTGSEYYNIRYWKIGSGIWGTEYGYTVDNGEVFIYDERRRR